MICWARMTLRSVILELHEEEGGEELHEYFPNGYIKITGTNTNRGFSLKKRQGWYAHDNPEVLQALFDAAKRLRADAPNGLTFDEVFKALHEANPNTLRTKIGVWDEVTLTLDSGDRIHYDLYGREDFPADRPHPARGFHFRFLDHDMPDRARTVFTWLHGPEAAPPRKDPIIRI